MTHQRLWQMAFAGLLTASVIAGGSSVLQASAADWGRPAVGINHRQANQISRIQHGVRNGEITHKEAHKLFKGQKKLQKVENRFRRDGRLSASERARLQRMASVQNRHIYRQAHDGNHRYNRVANRW